MDEDRVMRLVEKVAPHMRTFVGPSQIRDLVVAILLVLEDETGE